MVGGLKVGLNLSSWAQDSGRAVLALEVMVKSDSIDFGNADNVA